MLAALERVLGRDWVRVSNFRDEDVFRFERDRDIKIVAHLDPPLPYQRFNFTEPVQVHALRFLYTRYKTTAQKGERRLEQSCLASDGTLALVPQRAPRKGERLQFEPLVTVPSEIEKAIPLIQIGTNRSVREQLPSARNSMLRALLQDIERDFNNPATTIELARGGESVRCLARKPSVG